jgi:hypothetical protein
MMYKKNVSALLVAGLIGLALRIALIWWLWNWTLVSLGAPAINGWQALGLGVLTYSGSNE